MQRQILKPEPFVDLKVVCVKNQGTDNKEPKERKSLSVILIWATKKVIQRRRASYTNRIQ